MSADDRKKARLVEDNLRLVVSLAKRYPRPDGYAFNDIVDAGKIGFMKAVDSYEPPTGGASRSGKDTYVDMMSGAVVESNAAFEAHATPFIHVEMKRAIEQGTTSTTRSAEDDALLERIEQLREMFAED